MGTTPEHRTRPGELLRYRTWRGDFQGPGSAVWAIARTSLAIMLRRRLFWGLYACSLLIFFVFFYGQYLQVFVYTSLGSDPIRLGSGPISPTITPSDLRLILERFGLNGTDETYGTFIWSEGYILIIILALAGSMIIGNDFQHRSLAFYLAKPISPWHYILGKCLAIAVIVNLMTTIPALVLFGQYGLLRNDWRYYLDSIHLLIGILGYGLVLTVAMSLLLVATASAFRRTVPLIMIWTAMFVLGRVLGRWLVDGLKFHESWRLIDFWNDLHLMGMAALQVPLWRVEPDPQPQYWEAALVVGAVCCLCVLYLRRRLHGVEIIQ